jgi:hypothetical protein
MPQPFCDRCGIVIEERDDIVYEFDGSQNHGIQECVVHLLEALAEGTGEVVVVGSGSGYGIGEFGLVSWDTTTVPSGASVGLPNGVLVPHLATIGWGRTLNQTFWTPLNDLINRITALEDQL